MLIVALVATGVVLAFPQENETGGQHKYGGHGGCFDQLTEEQREALTQMIQELRDAGAAREEIKEAIEQFMEELGINIEDCRGPMDGFGRKDKGPTGGCFDQLTEEQREALTQMIQDLRDAGAAREEIREAIEQFMEELGINMEDCRGMKGHRGQSGKDS